MVHCDRTNRFYLNPSWGKTNTVVYYESINREVQRKPMYECRCYERLKTKPEGSTCLTGFLGELEHLKIETRLIDERFPSVIGECVFLT